MTSHRDEPALRTSGLAGTRRIYDPFPRWIIRSDDFIKLKPFSAKLLIYVVGKRYWGGKLVDHTPWTTVDDLADHFRVGWRRVRASLQELADLGMIAVLEWRRQIRIVVLYQRSATPPGFVKGRSLALRLDVSLSASVEGRSSSVFCDDSADNDVESGRQFCREQQTSLPSYAEDLSFGE